MARRIERRYNPPVSAYSLVPRYAEMPEGAKAWSVFDLQRAAAAGEIVVDEAAVARLSAAFAVALRGDPSRP